MFRIVFLSILFLFPAYNQAQIQISNELLPNLATVIPVNINQKMITASIDNKRAITFVLKSFETSDIHSSVYSVKGYYYDNYDPSKTTTLSGIYAGDYSLTLYAFADENNDDTLLNLDYQGSNFWEVVERYKNMQGFTEKFVFEELTDSIKGERFNFEGKSLPVSWNHFEVNICDDQEILFIPSKNKQYNQNIDLQGLGLPYRNFTVLKGVKIDDKIRLFLQFSYPSRHYLMGLCGSGQESGYLLLELDEDGIITQVKDILTESCLRDIGSENQSNRKEWKFKVVDHFTDHDLTRLISVNKTTLNWTAKKLD